MFDLTEKVAIVTGSSSGIGAHIALTLAFAGASVVAVGRREEKLRDLARRHDRIFVHPCDVTQDEECNALIDATVKDHGALDILINNAGVNNPEKAEHESPSEFRKTIDVNLVAPFVLSHMAAPHMLGQTSGGTIINIASVLGIVGIGRIPQAGYAASKGGLVNMTRELAAQWSRRGIRVNAIAPGWFSTEMTSDLFDTESGLEWIARLTPMGRGGELSELDGAVLYLASDASSYVTGIVLPVDGGWTAV